jgi:hypothetical protein
MRLLRSSLVLALLLSPVACTGKDDAAATADAAAAATASDGVEVVTVAPRDPPTIEVESTGDEPRRELRLHPAVGTREVLELSVGMRLAMKNGTQDLPSVPVPTTKTRLSAAVEEIGPDGVMKVRHAADSVEVIAGPETPAMVVEQVRQSVEPLAKFRAVMRMDGRGAVLGGEVELPRDLPPMVRQTMQQMTESLGQLAAPLPEPAVGPGAVWSATNVVSQNGMQLRQVSRYTLVSLDGDHAVLEATISQELLDPNVSPPGMAGVTARVSDFRSSGRSTMSLDLDRLMPRQVSMTMDLHMAMDMTVLGQAQHMEMDMGVDMTMHRADGG